jgi:hypothetical protein
MKYAVTFKQSKQSTYTPQTQPVIGKELVTSNIFKQLFSYAQLLGG